MQNAIRQVEDPTLVEKSAISRNLDATFNIDVNGWAHYNYGCGSLHKGRDGRLAHEFRPIAFALHRTERGDCYKELLEKTTQFIATFWNRTIPPSIICIDHHAGAAAAITSLVLRFLSAGSIFHEQRCKELGN